MKKVSAIALLLILITSSFIIPGKIEKEKEQEDTILEKVANANGLQNWKNVEEIKFTFNVDRDTTHFERTWTWKPKTNDITATTAEGTINYNWSNMDSVANKTNAGFINDKYWLLAPYQIAWDADNVKHTYIKKAEAPMSKKPMQKLTIVYGGEGGYTPGDAYDFYFGDDLMIKEWVFRRSNQAEPSMITSFEDYKIIKGLNIATMHKMGEGNFKLYFTNVEVN